MARRHSSNVKQHRHKKKESVDLWSRHCRVISFDDFHMLSQPCQLATCYCLRNPLTNGHNAKIIVCAFNSKNSELSDAQRKCPGAFSGHGAFCVVRRHRAMHKMRLCHQLSWTSLSSWTKRGLAISWENILEAAGSAIQPLSGLDLLIPYDDMPSDY